MENKTAIIVINHNEPYMTDALCTNIKDNTRAPYDLYVMETGSDIDKMSHYASVWTSEGIRMTRAFNYGVDYAIRQEKWKSCYYDSFWYVVNDAKFDEKDILTPLVEFMRSRDDVGQISPYIKNSPSKYQRAYDNVHKVSYIEVVCPLINREAIINYKIASGGEDLYNDAYYYGWGSDYESSYNIHQIGMHNYIHNEVSVYHTPGTTSNNGNDGVFNNVSEQFEVSRKHMIDTLTERHGIKWYQKMRKGISSDVSDEAFKDWVINVGQNCTEEEYYEES